MPLSFSSARSQLGIEMSQSLSTLSKELFSMALAVSLRDLLTSSGFMFSLSSGSRCLLLAEPELELVLGRDVLSPDWTGRGFIGLGPTGLMGLSPGPGCFSSSSAQLSWYIWGSPATSWVIWGVCVWNMLTRAEWEPRLISRDFGSEVQMMILASAISESLLMGMSALSTRVTRDLR